MALTYLCGLYLMPAGQRALKDKVVDIGADVGAALLNEGTFNTFQGLTVFIREIDSDGHIRGVLVHDNLNPRHPTPIWPESGQIVQTPAGERLILVDGTIETNLVGRSAFVRLEIRPLPFDLDQFSSPTHVTERRDQRALPRRTPLAEPGPETTDQKRLFCGSQ